MSAHESMEQAEHAKEASGENRKIALLIAVIALFLALSETLGKGAQTESISKNVEASNLWAFFQAKSIRRTVVQTASDQAKLSLGAAGDDAAKAALQKQIDEWQKTAARYRSEPETGEGTEQLAERAKHAEEERDLAEAKYHHSNSPRRRSRSASCWLRRPSSPAWWRWPGSRPAGADRHRLYRARPVRAASACICRSCSNDLAPTRCLAKLQDRVGKGLRRLLRRIVADTVQHAALIGRGEMSAVAFRHVSRCHAVDGAMQNDRRDT